MTYFQAAVLISLLVGMFVIQLFMSATLERIARAIENIKEKP